MNIKPHKRCHSGNKSWARGNFQRVENSANNGNELYSF